LPFDLKLTVAMHVNQTTRSMSAFSIPNGAPPYPAVLKYAQELENRLIDDL
jgi:hypothetical protein